MQQSLRYPDFLVPIVEQTLKILTFHLLLQKPEVKLGVYGCVADEIALRKLNEQRLAWR